MKTLCFALLLLLSIGSFLPVSAQTPEFAPVGAKWWYAIYESYPFENKYCTEEYYLLESIQDTLWKDKPARALTSSKYDCLGAKSIVDSLIIVYEEDNKVYYVQNEFAYLMYNWDAEVNDTVWIVKPGIDSMLTSGFGANLKSIYYLVKELTYSLSANGELLKIQSIETHQSYDGSSDYEQIHYSGIIIGVGGNSDWWANLASCNGCLLIDEAFYWNSIRCYFNGSDYLIKSNSKSCDYTQKKQPNSVDRLDDAIFSLFPNPANTTLNLSAKEDFRFEIINNFGQVVAQDQTTGMKAVIDLSKFPSGLYVIRSLNKENFSQKIIKN